LLPWNFGILFGARSVRFDRGAGRITFGPVWARQGRPLSDIVAVQLVSDIVSVPITPIRGSEEPPKSFSMNRFQINLVFDDGNTPRINVTELEDPAWTRQTGKQLADFLGVPLVDQIPGAK
jgi:hypothetical protein